jgi:membrane protease YdiL (CAAX protease family)
MTKTSKKSNYSLLLGKTILFTLVCITIFILVAIICELLTSWIIFKAPKIVVREIFLRMPLTIFSLHLFARRVIKAYDPVAIYGKLNLINAIKWLALGFILPLFVWLFYYLFHFIVPFKHTVSLNPADQLGLIAEWTAISIAAGLTEEVLFRGHLFMTFKTMFSTSKAILITSLIFGLVHIAMLTSFNFIDILMVVAGGTIAGIMFSAIYTYTKVIWYAAIVHIVWDIFFIGKITALASTQSDANQAIISFKLTTQNLLLAGGDFGVEAAVPCLIVYLALTLALYYIFKRKAAI